MAVVKEHLKQEVRRGETKKEQQTAGLDIWISFLTPADALAENNFRDRIAALLVSRIRWIFCTSRNCIQSMKYIS
jgi:hypothetical protein